MEAPFINTPSLLAKGFTRKSFCWQKLHWALLSRSGLYLTFTPLGKQRCKGLGLSRNNTTISAGAYWKRWAFTEEEIEAANTYICGTMTVEGAPLS
jgi:ribonucleoside-diphosphate reductase alpha chain